MSTPLLPILYGSQTGTAQEIAEYIAEKLRKAGVTVLVRPLDSFPLESWPLVRNTVFVVSTTGEGEVPDNMKKTWQFLLRRSLPRDSLSKMTFSLFGLGDSTYEKFCAAARKLCVRLSQLGAVASIPPGYGDEQASGGVWRELDRWLQTFYTHVVTLFPHLKPQFYEISLSVGAPHYHLQKISQLLESSLEVSVEEFYSYFPSDDTGPCTSTNQSQPYLYSVLSNQRITCKSHFQDVRHIEFEYRGKGVQPTYSAGDVAVIHPENNKKYVEAIAAIFSLSLEDIWEINVSKKDSSPDRTHAGVTALEASLQSAGSFASSPSDFPKFCSTFDMFSKILNISGTPSRIFFERLVPFATDPDEREKLLELCSTEGSDLLYEYCTRERRTYLEVLMDFPSCRPPLPYMIDMIPKLRPRSYSISSHFQSHSGNVHLCVALVRYKTFLKREKIGVCSSYISELKTDTLVRLWIRKGSFHMPSNNTPLILVGPGTGIAPIRSIIHQRHFSNHNRSQADIKPNCRDMVFFGCRYEEKDFHYRCDLKKFEEEARIILVTSFSREMTSPAGGRLYVQHRIIEMGSLICDLILKKSAVVFVSGSANKMPDDVKRAFRDVLTLHGSMTEQNASLYIKSMEREKRYHTEVWS